MKRLIALLCIGVMLMIALPVSAAPANSSETEWEILKYTNRARKQNGLAPLTLFADFQTAADIRAKENESLFSHTRPDGSAFYTAISSGIFYMMTAENIAMGQTSAQHAVSDWMDSPGHRHNMLNSAYTHMAPGYYKGKDAQFPDYVIFGHYWVQLFLGSCTATAVAIEGNIDPAKVTSGNYDGLALKVTCDMHGVSYMPLENADLTLKNGVLTAAHGGKSTSVTIPNTGIFSDVWPRDWFAPYVEYAYKNGIFSGYDGKFMPGSVMTRAQLVMVFANLAGANVDNNNVDSGFTDVPKNMWYTGAVRWAAQNGIVSGDGKGGFNPDGKITREQMCVMMVNFIQNYKKSELAKVNALKTFNDDAVINGWAKDSVYLCRMAGLVDGDDKGNFNPVKTATRAEGATLFSDFHKQYMK